MGNEWAMNNYSPDLPELCKQTQISFYEYKTLEDFGTLRFELNKDKQEQALTGHQICNEPLLLFKRTNNYFRLNDLGNTELI